MKKLHTRQKRKFDLATGKSGRELTKKRKKRPKTFRTEASAHAWAEKNKLDKSKYILVKVKSGKRSQVKKI